MRGSLRATSSRYAAPPSLSKDSISASLSAVVVLFCVPFGRPVCIRLANCAGDAISDMALLSIEPDSRFPFLLIRKKCAFLLLPPLPICTNIAPSSQRTQTNQQTQTNENQPLVPRLPLPCRSRHSRALPTSPFSSRSALLPLPLPLVDRPLVAFASFLNPFPRVSKTKPKPKNKNENTKLH